MNEHFIHNLSLEDFYRARKRAFFQRIRTMLKPQKYDLLSLEEVRKILSPRTEAYQGIKPVSIKLIVGSEGRYNDFNKEFLPRHDHLQPRWLNIDKLHLKNIILPPVQLYEIGGVYFVRDGNHRVSVARSQGIEAIDAEIVSLDSIVPISPKMDRMELKKAVIDYEKKCFEEKTQFSTVVPDYSLTFTCTGRYNEVLFHILEHKYFINQSYEDELPLSSAVFSWFENVYRPIIATIHEYGLMSRFPDRTEGDLYVWICKQWHILKEKFGEDIGIIQAAEDVVKKEGKTLIQRIQYFIRKIFSGKDIDT